MNESGLKGRLGYTLTGYQRMVTELFENKGGFKIATGWNIISYASQKYTYLGRD
jgi:hypothetical protein